MRRQIKDEGGESYEGFRRIEDGSEKVMRIELRCGLGFGNEMHRVKRGDLEKKRGIRGKHGLDQVVNTECVRDR